MMWCIRLTMKINVQIFWIKYFCIQFWVWSALALMMFVVFQAVFAWAAPFMDGIEAAFGWLGRDRGCV